MSANHKISPLRAVIADDHAMLRDGLRRTLSGGGIEVVGEAGDGKAALDLATKLKPDLVLIDISMPVLNGIDATRRITNSCPNCAVVVFSMHSEDEFRDQALAAGARNYVTKDSSTEVILHAVYEAAGREFSTQPAILSQREAEILQLIADGNGTTETAEHLFLSVKTVKNHLANVYSKLGVDDRTQAILRAAKLGIIRLDS